MAKNPGKLPVAGAEDLEHWLAVRATTATEGHDDLLAAEEQPQVLAKQFVGQLPIGSACGDPDIYLVPDQRLRQPGTQSQSQRTAREPGTSRTQ